MLGIQPFFYKIEPKSRLYEGGNFASKSPGAEFLDQANREYVGTNSVDESLLFADLYFFKNKSLVSHFVEFWPPTAVFFIN